MRIASKVTAAALALVAGAALFVATDRFSPGAPPPAPAAVDGPGWWPTAGYTVTNSGFNPNETAVTLSTVGGLSGRWTTSPARTEQHGPVLDDGRLFVPDRAGVTAYDAVTGTQLWRWEIGTDAAYPTTPRLVVTDEVVVAAYDYSTPPAWSSLVTVLDVARGTVQREITHSGVATTLLVDRDVVMVSGEHRGRDRTAAFRLADGEPLWTSGLTLHQPVSANGRVLLRGRRGDVQTSEILDVTTGSVVWTGANTWYDVLAADTAGTAFYVGWGHSLQRVDAATGAVTWLASEVYPRAVSVSPTRLYVVTAGDTLRVFDTARPGPVLWSHTFTGTLGKPVIAGGVLYVTVLGDRVHTLDPGQGTPLTAPAFTGAAAPPVVTDGKVYVTNGSQLTAYTL